MKRYLHGTPGKALPSPPENVTPIIRLAQLLFLAASLLVLCPEGFTQAPTVSYHRASDFPIRHPYKLYQSFDLETDSLGYAYMVRSGEVSRFNGLEITRLSLDPTLSGEVLVGLQKDESGRLWVYSPKLRFGVIDHDTVIPFPYPPALEPYRSRVVDCVHIAPDSTIHAAPRGKGIIRISPDGAITELRGKRDDVHGFVITRLDNGEPFHYSNFVQQMSLDQQPMRVYYEHPDGRIDTLCTTQSTRPDYESTLIYRPDGSWIFSLGTNDLIEGKDNTMIRQYALPGTIIKLFEDSRHHLWIGTLGNGIHEVKDGQLWRAQHHFGNDVAAVTAEDIHGGLWVKSSAHSFAYISNPDMLRYSGSTGQLRADRIGKMVTDHERILLWVMDGMPTLVDGDHIEELPFPEEVSTRAQQLQMGSPSALNYDTVHGWMWAGNSKMVASWDGEDWTTLMIGPHLQRNLQLRAFHTLQDSTVLAATSREIITIRNHQVVSSSIARDSIFDIRDITSRPDGLVYIACGSGLWTWDGENFARPTITSGDTAAIAQRGVGVYWFADRVWFRAFGGYYHTLYKGQLRPILDPTGKTLQLGFGYGSRKGDFWARSFASDFAAYRMHPEEDSIAITRYFFDDLASWYSRNDGFILQLDDKLYIEGKGGLFVTPIDRLKKAGVAPAMNIVEMLVGQKRMPIQEHYEFDYDQNSIVLNFEPISFRLQSPIIRCKLLGYDESWVIPKYNSLQYTNLDPGDYRFLVCGRVGSEPWGPMAEISFHIRTPFWQTWWFYLLEVLAAVGLIGGGFFVWYRIQRRRTSLQIEKLKAEQRALKAQMNPHFMYNALSSIQDLVFNENRVSAVTNIALFARLMRRILAHSSAEAISLTEEIETLELYLKLEALRFEDQFDFCITVGEGIRAESHMIPPVLIQPFAENAIKHGLLNRTPAGGHLKIDFRMINKALLCTIEDDGVGRERSAQIQAHRDPAHRSFGTAGLAQRIQLLNAERNAGIRFQTIDLKDDHGKPRGTRIELTIP